jgi:hypothetical protein
VNRGSNDVTVISGFTSITPVFNSFSTGGIDPVAAFAVEFAGQSLESLVVANSGDGLFTLLGGADGLEVVATLSDRELPEPTALVLASFSGDEVSFYATTAGEEAAFTLSFILPGFSPSVGAVPGSSGATAEAPGALVPPSETSLAIVGTLLVTMLNFPLDTVLNTPTSANVAAANENQAEVNTSFLSAAPSQGQGLFTQSKTDESGDGEALATAPGTPVGQGASAPPWVQSLLGLDELFQQIRQEDHDAIFEDEEPADTGKSGGDDRGDSSNLEFPSVPTPRANEPAPGPSLNEPSPHIDRADTQAIDEAIGSLWAVQPTDAPPTCPVSPVPTSPAPPSEIGAFDTPDKPWMQCPEPVPVWVPLVLSTTVVIHASPLAERLRERRRGEESFDHPQE